MMQKIRYRDGEDGQKVELVDLKLFRDEFFYYFSAKYRLEDRFGIREIHFPKILAPISIDYVAITGGIYTPCSEVATVDLGQVETYAYPGGEHNAIFAETVIEEKTHEMTLDEIEKKLGYKVKIVNKKE